MGYSAFGATLTWNSQTVAKLRSIGAPEISVTILDTTTHQSTSGFMEKVPSLKDAGDVTIEGELDYTDTNGQIAMKTDCAAGTSRTAVITAPSSYFTWTFTAYITKLKFGDFPHDGKIPFTATLTITGVPALGVTAVTGMSACGFSNDVLMMPTFAIGTYSYVVTITNGQTSTVITPVDATSGEVITITAPDGTTQTVATGVASSAITIAADEENVITITITKTGYSSKVYTFRCAVLAA